MKPLIMTNIRTTQDQIQPTHPVLIKLVWEQIELLPSIINAQLTYYEFTQVDIYRYHSVCKSLQMVHGLSRTEPIKFNVPLKNAGALIICVSPLRGKTSLVAGFQLTKAINFTGDRGQASASSFRSSSPLQTLPKCTNAAT